MSRFQQGQLVSDKFRVLSVLGEGAMGTVYAVEHQTLRTGVALKVLAPHLARRSDQVERFLREGVAISRVRHRAVVQVLDAGRHEDQPWIAMELLSGETLRARMSRGGLSANEALSILLEIAHGLAASHAQGIVHRDVKPSNISLAFQPDGTVQPKLLDFGVALVADAAERLTGAGMTMGTLHYMAPEQIHTAHDVDARADVYAIGAILFEILSGRAPYAARSVTELVAAFASQAPPDLRFAAPRQPAAITELVNRCLAKRREERPQDARQLAAMLEAALRFTDPAARIAPATLVVPGIAASRPGAFDERAARARSHAPAQAAAATTALPPGLWQQASTPGSWPSVASYPAAASPSPQASWPGAGPQGSWPAAASQPGSWTEDPFARAPKSSGLWHLAWVMPLALVLMAASAFGVVTFLEDSDDDERGRTSASAPTGTTSALAPPRDQRAYEEAREPNASLGRGGPHAGTVANAPFDPGSPMMPITHPPTPTPPVLAPQYPALVPTPVPTPTRHACGGEWQGSLYQSDGQRGSGVVTIEASDGACGGFVERWASGSLCHYRLSGCATQGNVLTASARAPARESCSPVRMRFTCEAGRMRFLESAPRVTVTSLMSRR